MSVVLADTGAARVLRAARWVQFNLPRTTTGIGIGLLTGAIAMHLYLLFGEYSWPAGWLAYYAVLCAGWTIACFGMFAGKRVASTQTAWILGDAFCVLFLIVYLVGRSMGLPGLSYVAGWWDFTAGTFAMAFTVGFLGVHTLIALGVLIARPQQRTWRD
ncbi:oxidoreductase [Tomitella cavernea]|uniref:Oxidoreductase n=1 Tax=Tomitella cavernea TaxID=1387982 RepID=A0ABP9CKV3_9ACTN|nr:oxidoreductase [Tomitella cavernea]